MRDSIETARLEALRSLNLIGSEPSENFDRITRMASQLFAVPIAAISLTDSERQWFKSRVGLDHTSIPRERAPCSEVAGNKDVLVINDIQEDRFYANSNLAATGARFYAGVPLITRDGHALGSLCVLSPEPRQVNTAELSALRDLAQMVMLQIEMEHAFGRIDPLSGLPNRLQFIDDLNDLAEDSPQTTRLAVLIDLARADQISSGTRVLGVEYIDQIVAATAKLLRKALGRKRKAYHISATQFIFLAPEEADAADHLVWLGATLKSLEQSAAVNFMMTAVIGASPFMLGVDSAPDIIRRAHSAALDARSNISGVSLYSLENDAAHRRRFQLLNDFQEALNSSRQLRLVFQPRIDLLTSRCVGAEALIRWSHPEFGSVPPSEFIPLVEQTSLAREVTAWVIDAALQQLAAWKERGLEFVLSVNISAANLEDADFASVVQLLLMKHRVRPNCLELELTESAIMQDSDAAVWQLNALSNAGIRLAIDDFGTGYSSLSYLQRLPTQIVKIDRSFIANLAEGEKERALVGSMITLSHHLGYRVVGEGVESSEINEMLINLGCDEAQGYFWARPMEANEAELWIMQRQRCDIAIAS